MVVTGPRSKRNAYKVSCPTCQAPAGHFCLTADGQVSRYAHAARDRESRPALPDLREWWKAMARFEGQFAQKRPTDLVVP